MDKSLTQTDAFTWFRRYQLEVVIKNGVVPQWFHGIISRKTSEELLMCKPPGYFLIRVSESRIGYTLSYRAEDRCRHFMIDALDNGYIILGENRRHCLLQDLVDYHRKIPIKPFTELLTTPCGQFSNIKTDYEELLFPKRHQNPSPTSPQMHPKKSNPVPQQDAAPALPHRQNNLTNSAALSPSLQPSRLYPSLDVLHDASPHPDVAPAVPAPRARYITNHTAPSQPPDLPSRSVDLIPNQNQTCIRTNCGLPSTPKDYPDHPDTKTSVVTNLKNLKKKFHKKSSFQQSVYEEINLDVEDKVKPTEPIYHEISDQQTVLADHLPHKCPDVGAVLPQEYLPPPPFAPGYS